MRPRSSYDTRMRFRPLVLLPTLLGSAALVVGCGTKTKIVTVTHTTTLVETVAAPAGAILMPRRDGELVYRPSIIALSDTAALTDVRWSSFGKRRAVGRGTYYLNACEPTCATAPLDKVNAKIDLTRSAPCDGHLAYKIITIEGPGMKVRDEPISRVISAARAACP
jgi:hypothetical protein